MKIFRCFSFIVLLLVFGVTALTGCEQNKNVKRIGIVLPIEHQALNEIANGFITTLQKLYHQPLEFKVVNAQGDMNMQRAIIEQMRDSNYAMIVPVSTSVTQMAVALAGQKPIVALAALYTEQNRRAQKSCNVAVVDDEIDKSQVVAFMHKVYPDIKTLALVHSAGDKIFPEVAAVKAAAKLYGIDVHAFMVTNLSELYTVGHAFPDSTQAIFMLKDNMIASGIETLIAVAKTKKIPLITSDEATVAKGASFALGVHEKQIGSEGAKLAVQILQGKSACQLPIVQMTNPTVFINSTALGINNLEQQRIESIAAQLHFPVEIIKQPTQSAKKQG